MPTNESIYLHLRACIASLDRAWVIISALEIAEERGTLAQAAYQMALIEYAKPFKVSLDDSGNRLQLNFPLKSKWDLMLHDKVINLRDRMLAHSDIGFPNSSLSLATIRGRRTAMLISDHVSLPEHAKVKALIEKILDKLNSQHSEKLSALFRSE